MGCVQVTHFSSQQMPHGVDGAIRPAEERTLTVRAARFYRELNVMAELDPEPAVWGTFA